MDTKQYILFLTATIILCVVPGPDMVLLLSRTVAKGRRAGILTALGINVGAYVHLIAAVAGISAVIATSALAFSVVKWVGAIYLTYLGISILRSKSDVLQICSETVPDESGWRYFWQGFWSDVLNPKVAIFYLAFLPQFVAPGKSYVAQLFYLGVSANIIGILSSLIVVSCSAALTHRLRKNARVSFWLAKALGSVFIALGARLAGEKTL